MRLSFIRYGFVSCPVSFLASYLGVLFFVMVSAAANAPPAAANANANAAAADASGTLVLETSKGAIRIALLERLAPKHVLRIKTLVGEGFYDGVVFHRVIPGFMAQTGDPTGTGSGGSGKRLKAEFSKYQYEYGTVGMARSMQPDSADSQFFICFDGCGHLTGDYTVWGQVESGMDVAESLNHGEPPSQPDRIIRAVLEAE